MTIGIIMGVLLPLIIVLAFCWLRYNNKQQKHRERKAVASWQFVPKKDSPKTPLKDFDEVDGVAPPSPGSSRRTDTLSPPSSSKDNASPTTSSKENPSPPSETGTLGSRGSRGSKTRRSYDKVYRTHEPLPNKPLIDFENKMWDLDEETDTSWTPSPKDSSTLRSSILSTPMQSPRTSELPPPLPSTSSAAAYTPVYEIVPEQVVVNKPKIQTLV
jgi:hypothetical protein